MAFGVTTDTFGLASGNIRCVGAGKAPEANSAQGEDSNGDVICEKNYGADTVFTREYLVGADTAFDAADTLGNYAIKLGSVQSGKQIHSIAAARDNKGELRVTVTGSPQGDTAANLPTYSIPWPTGYLTGGNGAKMAGLSAVTAGRVISSSITASVQVPKGEDSQGDIATKSSHGGRMEATNEVQSCDTTPDVTYDTANGWAAAAGSGAINQDNTSYESGTFSAFKNLTRDT